MIDMGKFDAVHWEKPHVQVKCGISKVPAKGWDKKAGKRVLCINWEKVNRKCSAFGKGQKKGKTSMTSYKPNLKVPKDYKHLSTDRLQIHTPLLHKTPKSFAAHASKTRSLKPGFLFPFVNSCQILKGAR